MYPHQIDELIHQEKIEQPQTLIFNKMTGAFVAKIVGDHLDKVEVLLEVSFRDPSWVISLDRLNR